jgi:tetratricopeptide (TPR) repeat protein
MFKERSRFEYGQARRKQTVKNALLIVLALILCVAIAFVLAEWKNRRGTEKKELVRLWDEGAYEQVSELSRTGLEKKPTNYFLLTLHGFASYQRAIAQINSFDTITYVDECIWSLRKALQIKHSTNDGRVQYVLGKAYYYKGSSYADLAIQFLEEARTLSYSAVDIPEYLGLSYAAVQDFRSSVEAFSQALGEENGGGDYPSDLLLVAIAQSYIALDEPETATAYLLRCIEISQDSNTVIKVRLLLGGIMAKAGKTGEAEAQYQAIFEEDGENAEAHFQLGELYYARGDTTRARAEWRRAVRTDPTHVQARARLGL